MPNTGLMAQGKAKSIENRPIRLSDSPHVSSSERTGCAIRPSVGSPMPWMKYSVPNRKLSRTTCCGHWGYDSGGIWVDGGCRARFSTP